MKNDFPNQLLDRLWHTTSTARYQMILEEGYIMPNPQISDEERFSAYRGPDFYPYIRTLGGVSLFDFEEFHPRRYQRRYPLSNWRQFVPYRPSWGESIWIEIKRDHVVENFVSAKDLLVRWRKDKTFNSIMPMIESAHIGPIPLAAFGCVLKYDSTGAFEVLL